MKVGILTLPLHSNYGGILQAHALKTFLEKKGQDVIFINRRNNALSPAARLKKVVCDVLANIKCSSRKEELIVLQHLNGFIREQLKPMTARIESEKELSVIDQYDFDAIIVGSDQVWRAEYYPGIKRNFFLDFVKNKKLIKLSYAASFGNNAWGYTDEETKELSSLIKLFDAVSVREESGMILCREHFGVNAVRHVDPTLLLSKENYRSLIKADENVYMDEGLFSYILDMDENKKNIINYISSRFNYNQFIISANSNDYRLSVAERVCPSMETWVSAFIRAKFVVTDSYHGCIFSMLFNKPFIAIGNSKRGMARFESLLQLFRLQDRMVSSVSDVNGNLLSSEINYNQVNGIIAHEVNRSRDYFTKYLGN